MKPVDKHEAAASVHAHASANGRDVLIEPHPKWSCEFREELLQVAKEATPLMASVPQALLLVGRALHSHLVGMANRVELVEWNDGKWYRDRSREITATNGDRYTARTIHIECGGPAGHCDCVLKIRDEIRMIAMSDECPKC